jgi:Domain of unknown function (DUF4034)
MSGYDEWLSTLTIRGSAMTPFTASASPAAHRQLTWVRALCVSAFLLFSAWCYAQVQPANTSRQSLAKSCASFGKGFDDGTDIHAINDYKAAIGAFVQQEDFDQLECIADTVRSKKARFASGIWQLHKFYAGASAVQGHATEEDWKERQANLDRWVAEKPQSITANVALAKFYVNYAWAARGDGMSDSVTGSGWKLLSQRLDKAKTILEQGSALHDKCPEWYLVMQDVALGQGWDAKQQEDLFKQATTFARDYYSYYPMYAEHLLPKWSGEDGDASNFAKTSADRMGGDQGDMLYFQIASEIVCPCQEDEFQRMSWPRLQKGYALLEKEYGTSLTNLNLLALMATKNRDSVVADAAFKRIGDNWDPVAWSNQAFFNQNKAIAAQMGALEARSRALVEDASANLQQPGGLQYQKDVEQSVSKWMQQCVQDDTDRTKFELMLQVAADGGPQDAWMPHPTTIGNCLLKHLYDSHVKNETPFTVPPRPGYWLKIELDPATSVAAK